MNRARWIILLIGLLILAALVQIEASSYRAEIWPSVAEKAEDGLSQLIRLEDEVYLFHYAYGTGKVEYETLTGNVKEKALTQFVKGEVEDGIDGAIGSLCARKAFFYIITRALPILLVLFGLCAAMTNKSVVIRIFCFSEALILISFCVLVVCLVELTTRDMDSIQEETLKCSLDYVYADMDENGYVSQDALITNINRMNGYFTEILVLDMSPRTGECYIVSRSSGGEIREIDKELGAEIIWFAQKQYEEKDYSSIYLPWGGYLTQVVGVFNWEHPDNLVLGILDGAVYSESTMKEINGIILILLIAYLIISALLIIYFVTYYIRWKNLVAAVSDVVVDNKEVAVPTKNTGGMTELWGAFREMYEELESMRYGMGQSIRTALLFMPANLERLVGKKTLSEVAVGDFRINHGTMLRNSMDSLKLLSLRAYEQFSEHYFEMVQELQRKDADGAIHINCDSDFSNNKLFFNTSADVALQYAIDATHIIDAQDDLCGKKHLFFLNTGDYSCGISGNAQRAVPFAYSLYDDLMEYYEDKIRMTGMEVVITEYTLKELAGSYSTRHIGYIVDTNSGEKVQLYEVLDVYTKEKKKTMLACMDKFYKAMELFASDDLYLARNTFNEVLQECPGDEITRWYLFNCEYYLNRETAGNIAHGLFENGAVTMQYISNK